MNNYNYQCIINCGSCVGVSNAATLSVCNSAITQQPQNQSIIAGSNVQFSVLTAATSFQWQQDAGIGFQNLTNSGPYSGVTTNTLTINNVTLSMDNYHFRCIIGDSLGCGDTTTVAILGVVTGINEMTIINSFTVSPNPTSGQITLRSSSIHTNKVVTVSIMNVIGEIMQEER